ncbi:magnesium transporter [Ekhidna sp.]|uniref:magnesium transporter n=1 Tax=Ekhidna sp. TaxID=2608089 RepID=UPI00329A5361
MIQEIKPWEILKEHLETESIDEIKKYLDLLGAEDIVGVVSHLSEAQRLKLLSLLTPEDAAELIEDLPWVQAIELIKDMNSKDAAAIIAELPSDEQADFLGEMSEQGAAAIMLEMPENEAKNIRELIQYEDDSAGGLMVTEFLSFKEEITVGEVVKDLQSNAEKYEKYNLQYIYVTHKGQFSGVLNMRTLLLSKPTVLLSEIVLRNALTVKDRDSQEDIIKFFDTNDFYGVPVVDDRLQLKGVVLRKDLREAQAEQENVEHLETQGIVGGEELRTMSVWLRARRRLSWLSVNILLNIAAASIIAFYQDTLSAVIALAVFLPIISDMSGCSGNQAVAVSLRELSLGVVRPFEVTRVWIQEISVGLLNGLVLGTLIGVAAWLWQGNIYLGLVVGGALSINTVVAVSLGGTIPLILKRMNVDPALASGPILTTVTDMFGFFLALTFAGMMLGNL